VAVPLLATLKEDPALNALMASSIQAYMQAGKPSIATLNGTCAHIVSEAACGVVVAANVGRVLTRAILTLASTPEHKRAEMGVAGRRYFEARIEPGQTARQLVTILTRVEARVDG